MIAHISIPAGAGRRSFGSLRNVATARLVLLTLHDEQIEWLGLGDAQHRENRMGLAAMVRLVIEKMGEYLPTTLPLRHAIESSILQYFLEGRFVQPLHESNDSAVLFHSRGVQRR